MTKNNNGSICTLSDFIREYGSEDLRLDTFYLKQVFYDENRMKHKIVVNENSIADKYANELEANKRIVEFNIKEYYKYRFNPKLLSYDVYGTTELWFFILMANELYTAVEFDLRKIIMYDASIITKLNRMLNMDSEFLEINSMAIKAETDEGINY